MDICVVHDWDIVHTLELDELGDYARMQPGDAVIVPTGKMYAITAVAKADDGGLFLTVRAV